MVQGFVELSFRCPCKNTAMGLVYQSQSMYGLPSDTTSTSRKDSLFRNFFIIIQLKLSLMNFQFQCWGFLFCLCRFLQFLRFSFPRFLVLCRGLRFLSSLSTHHNRNIESMPLTQGSKTTRHVNAICYF